MLPPTPVTELEVSQQLPKPEINTYKKVNAYTHKASLEQIITIIAMIVQLALHCIFMIRPIFAIDHPLLYFIWAILIMTLVCMIIDYFILTCGDPADRLLEDSELVEVWKNKEIKYDRQDINKQGTENKGNNKNQHKKNPYLVKGCKACNRPVKILSYHCWTCRRCSQNMDHHCKYLNNCIGSRNYNSFFRLLSATCIYLCCSIVIGIWVLRVGFIDQNVDQLAYTKWMGLAFALFCLVCLIVVMILLCFHCYISCYLRMTTIQYIFRDTQSNNQSESNDSSVKSMKQIE